MPSDIRIPAAAAYSPLAPMERMPVVAAPAQPRPADPSPAHPNPAMHLDPALNMVILEFRDAAGKVTNTLPTAHALEQFRLNMAPPPQSAAAALGVTQAGTPGSGMTEAPSQPSPTSPPPAPGAEPPESADLIA